MSCKHGFQKHRGREAVGQADSEQGPAWRFMSGRARQQEEAEGKPEARNNKADSSHDEYVCAKIKLGLFS